MSGKLLADCVSSPDCDLSREHTSVQSALSIIRRAEDRSWCGLKSSALLLHKFTTTKSDKANFLHSCSNERRAIITEFQTENISPSSTTSGNGSNSLAGLPWGFPVEDSDSVLVVHARAGNFSTIRGESNLHNSHSERAGSHEDLLLSLVVPNTKFGPFTDLASGANWLSRVDSHAVDIIGVTTEESLSIGSFVINDSESSSVVQELSAIVTVEQVVAGVVASVTVNVLEVELSFRSRGVGLPWLIRGRFHVVDDGLAGDDGHELVALFLLLFKHASFLGSICGLSLTLIDGLLTEGINLVFKVIVDIRSTALAVTEIGSELLFVHDLSVTQDS